MAGLLDLPQDVVEIVFKYLVSIDDGLLEGLSSRSHAEGATAARLRLVCRKWDDWFFVHHLHRTLTFTDGTRSLEFTRKLIRPGRRRPLCQHLMIYDIWTPPSHCLPESAMADQPARSAQGMMNSCESIDLLVAFFADTVVELDLEFISCFWLPTRTIELIGRIENLAVLRLALKSEWLSECPSLPTLSGEDPDESGGCLGSLIRAARGLEGLDISQLPPQCLPRHFPIPLQTTPTITQLDIKLVDEQPIESLINLSRALKPSLKVLSIQSFRDDGLRLVPIFETLRENLEGLFISHESALTHILQMEFPKLRVFRIHYWDGCLADLLTQDLFAMAPIRLIAIYSHTVYRRKNLYTDPFARLRHLEKFVFLHARLGDSPPLSYIKYCRAHRLPCIFLNHGDIPEIMKLSRS